MWSWRGRSDLLIVSDQYQFCPEVKQAFETSSSYRTGEPRLLVKHYCRSTPPIVMIVPGAEGNTFENEGEETPPRPDRRTRGRTRTEQKQRRSTRGHGRPLRPTMVPARRSISLSALAFHLACVPCARAVPRIPSGGTRDRSTSTASCC
jgi:hypothetical protein